MARQLPQESLLECSFLIPLRRDAEMADGAKHRAARWRWLDGLHFAQFGGATLAPGKYEGAYTDPDTGQRVRDKSYKYIVAIADDDIDRRRSLLREAAASFSKSASTSTLPGASSL
jgi:hypothetical protein